MKNKKMLVTSSLSCSKDAGRTNDEKKIMKNFTQKYSLLLIDQFVFFSVLQISEPLSARKDNEIDRKIDSASHVY